MFFQVVFLAALANFAHAGIIGQIGLSSGLAGGYGIGIANVGYAKTPVVDQYVSIPNDHNFTK